MLITGILLFILLICTLIITYQDFKTRLISVWIIIAFAAFNIGLYLYKHSFEQLLYNALFTFLYLALLYGTLQLYFFIKTKRLHKLVNEQIGWGDVWLILAIAPTLEWHELIYFFTTVFCISLLVHLLFFAKRIATVPLAAYLVAIYWSYLLFKICLLPLMSVNH